jgi:hypothetical protein
VLWNQTCGQPSEMAGRLEFDSCPEAATLAQSYTAYGCSS